MGCATGQDRGKASDNTWLNLPHRRARGKRPADDGTVRSWDTRTREQLGAPLKADNARVNSAAWLGSDGRTVALATDDQAIQLWDARSHKRLGEPLSDPTGTQISVVAFSRDGRTLATGANTIRLWDVRTHKQLGNPLNDPKRDPYSLAFSPDRRTLAAAGGTIRLWEGVLWPKFAELQTRVCGLVGVGLSPGEWAQYAAGTPYHQSCR